ncbi:CAP domain-containing protein [Aestuariivirga sp.]|uniref:CAP domain-containing protein n=1 Tax=Aestuariivirga sp. TaxID=2650926 RepID=UPI0039E3A9FD
MTQGHSRRGFIYFGGCAAASFLVPRLAEAGTYLSFAKSLAANPPAGSRYRPDLETELFGLANGYRAQKGKGPLTASQDFLIPARAHAADMMLHNFIGHRASTGQDFDSRMRAFVGDITKYPSMAENAAHDTLGGPADQAKGQRLFQQWVNSPGHAKTLRSLDYFFVSTGVIERQGNIWAVQIFWGKPRAKGLYGTWGLQGG